MTTGVAAAFESLHLLFVSLVLSFQLGVHPQANRLVNARVVLLGRQGARLGKATSGRHATLSHELVSSVAVWA